MAFRKGKLDCKRRKWNVIWELERCPWIMVVSNSGIETREAGLQIKSLGRTLFIDKRTSILHGLADQLNEPDWKTKTEPTSGEYKNCSRKACYHPIA